MKEARLGVDFYVIRDASGSNTTFAGGQTNLNTLGRIFTDYGVGATSFTYDPSTFYFLGVDGAFKAGPVGLSGYAFYNWGEIKNINGLVGGDNIVRGSADVKAYAVDLRADVDAGPGKFFIEAAYVSGSDRNSNDLESPITASNYALAASYPLTSMDMQILFPNADDINASVALAYDVQNKGRGIMAAAAGFRMQFNNALSGKVGVGYLADVESPGSGVKEHSAFEVNANVNFALAKGLDLGLYAAYAFLNDWEAYSAAGVASSTVDADDIWKAYLRLNYAF